MLLLVKYSILTLLQHYTGKKLVVIFMDNCATYIRYKIIILSNEYLFSDVNLKINIKILILSSEIMLNLQQ